MPPSGESAGRGWCEEPHFNEGRANANHCNRQQQQKGEAAAARAPQQRSPAGRGVTKASEPLSAAAPAIAAGWSPGGGGAAAPQPLPSSARRRRRLPSSPCRQLRGREALAGLRTAGKGRGLRRGGRRGAAVGRAPAAARCTCAHCVGRRPPLVAAGLSASRAAALGSAAGAARRWGGAPGGGCVSGG